MMKNFVVKKVNITLYLITMMTFLVVCPKIKKNPHFSKSNVIVFEHLVAKWLR